jgi:ribulose 1,5-bisphosphate carboxylase large subunit-like protein
MALNHPKMRRIVDKYWRVPGRSLTRQWDGNEATLQAYFDEQGVSNATASEVIAKESDYDTWLTSVRASEAWKARMASFVMTRVEEEVISNLTAEQKAALPQYTRDQHAQKLVARGEKP